MNSMKIERGEVYIGTRAICDAMRVSRNTLKAYISQGLRVRRMPTGALTLSGDDVMDWYGKMPLARKK